VVKRVLVVGALAVLTALGVGFAQQLERDGRYRSLLAEGERALAAGQTYLAIETFSGALALRPESMVAYYRRGEAYQAQRQYDRAVGDLREAARLSPEAPEPLVALGDLFNERGEPALAAEWYGQAAERLQDADPALLYRWALALYRAGSPVAARGPLRQALGRDDSLASAHYLLGLVHRDAQEFDEAMASLERAVRLVPTHVAAREELADLYRAHGRPADELAELETIRTLDRTADRDVAIALAYLRQGQFDRAQTVLEAARAAAPSDSRVGLAIGRVLLARAEASEDRGAAAKALIVLDRALGGTAPRSQGLALFGRALYLTGDAAAAERILREAVATSPVDTESFGFLADAAERLGHAAVARDALLDLDALEGDTAASALRAQRGRRIGALSLEAGDERTAVTWLTFAVDTGPADAGTLGLLARARWETGDFDGARSTLTRALAVAPFNADLLRLQRTIR
jgi:tetratricopeptide (TPR) repeat protein